MAPVASSMGVPDSNGGKLIQVHIDNTPAGQYHCDGNNLFQLEGSSNAVRITGHCRMLQVEGSSNAITIDQVEGVQVQGNSNMVTWLTGSKPSFASEGSANSLQRGASGSGGTMASSDGSTATLGGSSGSGAAIATDRNGRRRVRVAGTDTDVVGSNGETVRQHNGTPVVRGSNGQSIVVNPDGSTTLKSSTGNTLNTSPQ